MVLRASISAISASDLRLSGCASKNASMRFERSWFRRTSEISARHIGHSLLRLRQSEAHALQKLCRQGTALTHL